MKKTLIFLIILLMNIFSLTNIFADEAEELIPIPSFKYDDSYVTYYESNIQVLMPAKVNENKAQFKAAYISTLDNHHLHAIQNQDIETFKKEYRRILNIVESYYFNVIIFEVKPLLDAFYLSNINPTSKFLVGEEGSMLNWDPLKWMIDEAHERNIDFYAQLNPFLVSNLIVSDAVTIEDVLGTLSQNNFASKNPDTVVVGNDHKLYLNPGLQEVKDYLVASVNELLSNYGVDGIHFNSSFYPEAGLNPVYDTFLNEELNQTIDLFRMNQVQQIIDLIDANIGRFNILNQRSVQLGLTYKEKYAPFINVSQISKHLDYIIIEVHENFETDGPGYADIVKEWSEIYLDSAINLYLDLNLNLSSQDYEREIANQIRYAEQYASVKGYVFTDLISFHQSEQSKKEQFKKIVDTYLKSSVFLPESATVYVPQVNRNLVIEFNYNDDIVELLWNAQEKVKYYVVYKFTDQDEVSLKTLKSTKYIVAVLKNDANEEKIIFRDSDIHQGNKYKYLISVVDLGNRETDIPTIYDVDLSFENKMSQMIVITSIIGVVTIVMISVTAYTVLKKE